METKIELKAHNQSAVNELREALKVSQRVCTMRATGTGKSYIIAELIKDYDNALIMAPSTYIIEQQKKLIGDREGVNYVTYQKTITKDYIIPTNIDAIFLDEFHRVGAEIWGNYVYKIIEKNPKAKVIGFTATTIRGLEGRDMAQEVFNGNIVSPLSLPEAWVDGILKLPIYVSSFYEIDEIIKEEKKKAKWCKEAIEKLRKLDIDWKKSGGVPSIIMEYLPKNSKRVIVFLSNIAELKRMRKTIEGWFKLAGFHGAKFYEIHKKKSNPGKELAKFEKNDEDDKLKVILSVNMLNEGLHVPDVDSVMFLRKTESNIIFLQQMGRCLTVDHKKTPIIFDFVGNIDSTCINSISEINKELEEIQRGRGIKEDKRIRLDIKGTLLDTVSILRSIQGLYYKTSYYKQMLQDIIDKGDYSEIKNGTYIYYIVYTHKKENGPCEFWPEAKICWENRPRIEINPNLLELRKMIEAGDYSKVTPSNLIYVIIKRHKEGGTCDHWPEADICWENRPKNQNLVKLRKMIEAGDYSEVTPSNPIYSVIQNHKKGGPGEHWPEADVCWENKSHVVTPLRKILQRIIKKGDYSEVRLGTRIYNTVCTHKKGSSGKHWPEADICWENRCCKRKES